MFEAYEFRLSLYIIFLKYLFPSMKSTAVVFYIFSSLACSAQIYEIPNADEQPSWVFPLWFEDASGARDTIYFAYDPEGENFGWPQSDTIFGEKETILDTTKFAVYWASGPEPPNVIKVLVWGDMAFGSEITFVHTLYPPLKVSWDPNLFYDTNIPFPTLDPLPSACGKLLSWENMSTIGCSYMYPIILTDTSDGSGLACYFSDSIIFNTGLLSGLTFWIVPWQPNFNNIQISEPDENYSIYPNPVNETLTIASTGIHSYSFQLINSQGQIITRGVGIGESKINLTNETSGIYLIRLMDNHSTQIFKILKL